MLRLTVTFLLVNNWIPQTIQVADRFELLILHTNDIRSKFEETTNSRDGRKVGGCARVAHVVKEARKASKEGKGPPVLYFDAGDIATGSAWFSLVKENITIDIMNELKPDAACLGTHEMEYNLPVLKKYLKMINFPVVVSNFEFNNETALQSSIKKSLVLTVRGKKIGIVGFLTPEAGVMAEMGGMKILDEVTALKRLCDRLVEEGVNIIIAVGHSGYFTNKFVARELQAIDIVVGGSGSTFMWNGPQPDKEVPIDSYPGTVVHSDGKYGMIVQAHCCSKYIGKLLVTFKSRGDIDGFSGQPIFLDETIPQDQKVLDVLEKYRAKVDTLKMVPACRSRVFLDGTDCWRKECNYGNLIVDSFIKYNARLYDGPSWTDAAVAIINAGSIVASIDAPSHRYTVNTGDVLNSLPNDDNLYTTDIKGKYLKQMLEIGTELNPYNTRGAFLVTSGLKVVYNFNNRYGERVRSIKVRCAQCEVPRYFPLEPEAVYKIITIRFLLKGGDGYRILMDNCMNTKWIGCKDSFAVVTEMQYRKYVAPEIGGRIMLEETVSTNDIKRQAISNILILLLIKLLLLWQ